MKNKVAPQEPANMESPPKRLNITPLVTVGGKGLAMLLAIKESTSFAIPVGQDKETQLRSKLKFRDMSYSIIGVTGLEDNDEDAPLTIRLKKSHRGEANKGHKPLLLPAQEPNTESDASDSASDSDSSEADSSSKPDTKSSEAGYNFVIDERLARLGFKHANISGIATTGKNGSAKKQRSIVRSMDNLATSESLKTLEVLIGLGFSIQNISGFLSQRSYNITQLTKCLDNIKILVEEGVKPEIIVRGLSRRGSKATEDFKDLITNLVEKNGLQLQPFSKPKAIPYPRGSSNTPPPPSTKTQKKSVPTKKHQSEEDESSDPESSDHEEDKQKSRKKGGAKASVKDDESAMSDLDSSEADSSQKSATKSSKSGYNFVVDKRLAKLGLEHKNISGIAKGKSGSAKKQCSIVRSMGNLTTAESLETLEALIRTEENQGLGFRAESISNILKKKSYKIVQLTKCLANIRVLVEGGVEPTTISGRLARDGGKATEDFQDVVTKLIEENELQLQPFSKPKAIPYPQISLKKGGLFSTKTQKKSAPPKKHQSEENENSDLDSEGHEEDKQESSKKDMSKDVAKESDENGSERNEDQDEGDAPQEATEDDEDEALPTPSVDSIVQAAQQPDSYQPLILNVENSPQEGDLNLGSFSLHRTLSLADLQYDSNTLGNGYFSAPAPLSPLPIYSPALDGYSALSSHSLSPQSLSVGLTESLLGSGYSASSLLGSDAGIDD